MRIILYTGKGGVGKTSVSAATALRCAELGHRTVVLSTDPAHSLADSFDIPLAPEPKQIGERLWGQEVDIYHEIGAHWGTIDKWLVAVMQWRGLSEIMAEEMAALPGMDELASLIQIVRHYESGRYDVIIVDCAPTGETLRLLAFPEVMRWYLEKIFPVERKVAHVVRPVLRSFIDMPLPGDDVFQAVEDMFKELAKMHDLLANAEMSSVRLVLNPEKMVIKEAHRTYTYLGLYGYSTDAVICNRLLPAEVQDKYFDAWKEVHQRYEVQIEESFAPLPILKVPLFDQEVVGPRMLELMAASLFGEGDPAQIYFRGQGQTIEKEGPGFVLSLPLPFTSKGDVELLRSGDELVVRVGNWRRNLILPRALVALSIKGARLEGQALRIRFIPQGGDGET